MGKRFTFRLERVLAYRCQREEQARMELARASTRYRHQGEKVSGLRQELEKAHMEFARKKNLTQNDLWLWQGYKQGMEHTVSQAEQHLRELARIVVRCREEVVKRSRERKILETLKLNQAIEHEQREKRREQKELDEMVQVRLARQAS